MARKPRSPETHDDPSGAAVPPPVSQDILVADLEADAGPDGDVVPLPVHNAAEDERGDVQGDPHADGREEGDWNAQDASPLEGPGPAKSAPRSVSELHLKGILESLVFVSDKPVGA